MPQCRCGRFFKQSRFPDGRDEDICPVCRKSSSPENYINSKDWIGGTEESDYYIQQSRFNYPKE